MVPQVARQDDRSWRDIPCDYGSLTDVTNDPMQQWIDAKASDAMGELFDAFNADSKGLAFPNFVADFFHARPGIDCGDIADNANCQVTISCGSQSSGSGSVVAPAGYLVINSMVSLHVQYKNFYEGLLNALEFMMGEFGRLSEIFAPQFDESKEDKILLDFLNILFGVVSAGVFNSCRRSMRRLLFVTC
jgi:hypothetical protein